MAIPKKLTETQQFAVDHVARGAHVLSIKKGQPTVSMEQARAWALEKLFSKPWDDKREQVWSERADKALLREMGVPNGKVVRSGPIKMKAVGSMDRK